MILKRNIMKVYYNVSHFELDSQAWIINNLIEDMVKRWPLYKIEFYDSVNPRVEIKQRNSIICDSNVRLTRIKANRFLKSSLLLNNGK